MQSDDAAPPGPPGSDMIREGDHLILKTAENEQYFAEAVRTRSFRVGRCHCAVGAHVMQRNAAVC